MGPGRPGQNTTLAWETTSRPAATPGRPWSWVLRPATSSGWPWRGTRWVLTHARLGEPRQAIGCYRQGLALVGELKNSGGARDVGRHADRVRDACRAVGDLPAAARPGSRPAGAPRPGMAGLPRSCAPGSGMSARPARRGDRHARLRRAPLADDRDAGAVAAGRGGRSRAWPASCWRPPGRVLSGRTWHVAGSPGPGEPGPGSRVQVSRPGLHLEHSRHPWPAWRGRRAEGLRVPVTCRDTVSTPSQHQALAC